MMRTVFLVAALAALGCGGGNGGGGNGGSGGSGGGGSGGSGGSGGGGGSMSGPDLAMPPADLANAFSCDGTVCMGSERCCVQGMTASCAMSCNTDLGFEAQCNSPANCGGNPCCITIAAGFKVQSVVCGMTASACPPMVDATTQSGMDRACTVDKDCTSGVTSPSLPDCCTNTTTAQHVCFNKSYLGIPGITGWTCP
jgi:hypothetical protein